MFGRLFCTCPFGVSTADAMDCSDVQHNKLLPADMKQDASF